MTLIITMIGNNKVVQVSDCRLTSNGEMHDKKAIKALGVACANAQFCVGYSGVGEIEGLRPDYWLMHQIQTIFLSGTQGVRGLAWALGERAEEAIASLRYRGVPVKWENRGPRLVLAGYHEVEDGSLSYPFITT